MIGFAQIGLILALVGGIFVGGFGYGTSRANKKHEFQRLQAVEKAREREAQWQDDVEVLQDVHQTEIRRIAAARDAAVRELRNRPDRVPEAAAPACNGSTGLQLSRPDADFLVGEASRADQLRADLQACQSWAETVTKGTP